MAAACAWRSSCRTRVKSASDRRKNSPSPLMGEGGRRTEAGAPEPIPANERTGIKRGRARAGSLRSRPLSCPTGTSAAVAASIPTRGEEKAWRRFCEFSEVRPNLIRTNCSLSLHGRVWPKAGRGCAGADTGERTHAHQPRRAKSTLAALARPSLPYGHPLPQGERRKRGGGSTNSQKSDPTSYERTVPSPFMGEGGRRPGEGAPGPIAMTKWSCVERGTSKARSAALALPSPARWAPRPLSRTRFPQGERRKHAAAVLPALVCSSKPHANKLLPSPFTGEGGRRPGEGAPESIPANERRRLKRGRVRAGSLRSRTPLLPYGHLGRFRGLDSHKERGERDVEAVWREQYQAVPISRRITTRNPIGNPSIRSRATICTSCPPHCASSTSAKPRAA